MKQWRGYIPTYGTGPLGAVAKGTDGVTSDGWNGDTFFITRNYHVGGVVGGCWGWIDIGGWARLGLWLGLCIGSINVGGLVGG